MTSLETLATMIACIGHDVDHRGRTNGFEVNTFSDLALLYNDQSVLENHHCSTTLRLLRKSENNFISNFSMDQVRDFRAVVVAAIMHTDMTKHFEMVEKFKTRDPKALILPSGKRKPDLELMGYLTHCADLSNGLRIPPISKKWTILVDQEFKEQVAEEKELGMPLSMFLYAENTSQLAKREANFIEHIVTPLWSNIKDLFPLEDKFENMKKGKDAWVKLIDPPS